MPRRLGELEKKAEQDTVDWWEGHGNIAIKLNLMGRRGWPDRLFLDWSARPVFIEFKRVGEKERPLQEYIHELLRRRGYEIYVCYTFDDAKSKLLASPGVPEGRSQTPY